MIAATVIEVPFVFVSPDPRVVCAIASSPPRFVHQAYLSSPNGPRFKADIDQAHHLVDNGQPEALIEGILKLREKIAKQGLKVRGETEIEV